MLKRITTLAVLVLILFSCSTQRYTISTSGYDLSRYADQGFIMTTTNINHDYVPVSIVNSVCISGSIDKPENEVEEKDLKEYRDVYYTSSMYQPNNYKPCIVPDLLDEMYQQCVDMGANALINIEILASGTTITCTGLAVKVK